MRRGGGGRRQGGMEGRKRSRKGKKIGRGQYRNKMRQSYGRELSRVPATLVTGCLTRH